MGQLLSRTDLINDAAIYLRNLETEKRQKLEQYLLLINFNTGVNSSYRLENNKNWSEVIGTEVTPLTDFIAAGKSTFYNEFKARLSSLSSTKEEDFYLKYNILFTI